MTREAHLVELVDDAGVHCGQSTVETAHEAPGLLHRAFSVLVVDQAGRLLLQRRSAYKTRFPLRWANACCGHPSPGQPVTEAAARRLVEELSVTGLDLVEIGVYAYAASDPASGRIEREYDHVLVGRVGTDLAVQPDPAEVDEVRWVSPAELRSDLVSAPDRYAPWLPGVLALLPDTPLS
ncbi:MAG: isopentenyl-diphosphate delta-isomerase [Actinobacteria bacterium 13_1_20CM_3_71_11]|nr:MAG: isopentenyl-diphosphate delta-isomerase [Actinobacteria bacterium 13_1_20CM_3_71_11]